MMFKVTCNGYLEFGNAKIFEKMFQTIQQRTETFYKNDVLFKPEHFDVEGSKLVISKFVAPVVTEKCWKNTVGLLETVVQYAMAGKLHLWVTDEKGGIKHHSDFEPNSEKTAIQEYKKGKKLSRIEGKETEAIEALHGCIARYAEHAPAHERIGRLLLRLDRFEEAVPYFDKSIALQPAAEAHFGKANWYMMQSNFEMAISEFEHALRFSIPLQPIFWQSRRLKAECHIKLNELDKAEFELRFFTKRSYAPNDPNYPHVPRANELYQQVCRGLAVS